MPLVVPGMTGTGGGDKTDEWNNKLAGKTLSEEPHSETVFCKKDLPEQCRVVQPGQMVTKDHQPDRLTVMLKDDGTVSHVYHG